MGPKRQNNKRKGEAQQQQGEKRGKAGTGSGAAGVSEVILKKLSKEGLGLKDLPPLQNANRWILVKEMCGLNVKEMFALQDFLFPPSAETSSSSSSPYLSPPSAGEI